MPERFRRASLGAILTVIIFVLIGSFGFARPANAGFPVTVLADLQSQMEQVYAMIKENLMQAILQGAINAVSSAMKKIAYDSAVWLASGGKGQSPFAHTNSFGDYMEEVADDAGGRFIETLGDSLHMNLCNIPDVRADLKLRIGLKQRYDPSTAVKRECKFSEFIENWSSGDNWASQYGSEDALLKRFNASIVMEDTDFGIYLDSAVKLDQTITRQQDAAKSERLEGGGWKSLTSLISGDILTPSQQIQHEANANLPSEQNKRNEQQIGFAMGSGAFQIIPTTLSTFLNTLSSQMLKNFQTKGILPFGMCVGGYGGEHCKGNDPESYEGARVGGRRAAEALFADYLNVKVHSVSDYPVLDEFVACDDGYNASPNNCTVDQSFAKAIEEARYSDPLTIKQAVEQGLLNGSWKLISPKNKALNNDKNCRNTAFCYNNIKKLRLAGILPLGFEIAALNADPDTPASLDDYLKGFDDCNYVDPNNKALGVLNDQSNKPFCHLIDPNWILKVDSARCNAKVYGNEVAPNGDGSRMEECVDMSTCVGYNPDGSCYSYGYCLRSQNYWDFDLDKCDRQYATCDVYSDKNGNSVSYLSRTLQTEDCTKENAGCTAYSLLRVGGAWMNPVTPSAQGAITIFGAGGGSFLIPSYENAAVHFNDSVDTSCSAQSAGCSAFKVSSSQNTVLSLKKAPDYLYCYDADVATRGIQWPVTFADLQRVKNNASPECSNYTGVCIPNEVGCALYTPLSFVGRDIPGKFKPAEVVSGQLVWNDQCDKSCVGYDAYKEMPSTYASGHDPVYIIPGDAAACRIEDEGCSSFTNLSTTAGQQEKVEYYSYLRSCVKPGPNVSQKNFYTYEGSVVGGYQLQVFTLQSENGAPKYSYRDQAEKTRLEAQCTPELYRKGQASPDCRQFNDEAGNIYYALLSKTIVVSDQCTPYRLNSSDFPPGQCYQNGEYRDGFCYYYGLPAGVESKAGASRSCSASVESCRAYKGNSANRTQKLFEDTFEAGTPEAALSGWNQSNGGSISQSPESTRRGEHSLGFSGNSSFSRTVNVRPGRSYILSFWAKGNSPSLNVEFQNSTGNFGRVGVGATWQNYRLGPTEYTGTATSTVIRFSVSGSTQVYVDNVELVEVTDYLYLVKNKLTVPDVCDSNKLDDQPGEALGCSAYRSSGTQNNEFYLTGFSYLCRDEALGCTALLDTYNTVDDPGPSAYNVWFSGAGGSLVKKTIQGKEYSCQIQAGKDGCYVNIQGVEASVIDAISGVSFVTSSQYIPADTPSSTPIYLVANQAGSCNAVDLGCTLAGKQEFGPRGAQYTTTTIKNLPANYSSSLCTNEAVGCTAYGFNQGTTYFKDPKIFGNKVCEYKTGVSVDSVKSNGWFWKGVGKCSNTASTNSFCESDKDCEIFNAGLIGGATSKCQNIGSQPCYSDYVQNGEYGLWSSGNEDKYQNFVGECPSSQSSCTEFVDHNKGANVSYYFLQNEKLKTKQDACQGQVSEKLGCILLDQTDQPSKYWSTASTYLLSEKNGFASVTPDSTGTKDANLIVKVTQNRKCAEWLACNSSQTVFDPDTNSYKEVCIDLGICNKAQLSDTIIGQCASWVDTSKADSSGQVIKNKMLTNNGSGYNYLRRDVSFYGKDFTGYSLFNSYQIDDLSSSPIGSKGLGFKINNTTYVSPSNASTTVASSCRGYPEPFSPFPFEAKFNSQIAPRTCSEGENCDCSYTKGVFGDSNETIEKYYSLGKVFGPEGVCRGGLDVEGGSKDGLACLSNEDCLDDRIIVKDYLGIAATASNGTCMQRRKEESKKYTGWQGYCLDFNANTAHCDLWFPIDTPSNSVNRYNLFSSAGYLPADSSGKYWCLQAKGNSNIGTGNGSYKYTTRVDDNYLLNQYFWDYWASSNDWNMVIPRSQHVRKTWVDIEIPANEQENKLHYSEIVAVGIEPTSRVGGTDRFKSEIFIFRDQQVNGKQIDRGVYWASPLEITLNGDLVMEFFWQENLSSERPSFEAFNLSKCNLYSDIEGEDYNAMGMRLIFDGNTGLLKKFWSKSCDASAKSGGIKVKLNVYLTEVCEDVRKVVDTESTDAKNEPFGIKAKARTDRIWKNSKYKLGGDPEASVLSLSYDQMFTPFGSFNRDKDPNITSLKTYLNAATSKNDKPTMGEKINRLSNAGYWPIWLAPGGGTPLNCANKNGGSCGGGSYCQDMPNGEIVPCDPEENDGRPLVCRVPVESTCELRPNINVCTGGPKNQLTCNNNADCNTSGVVVTCQEPRRQSACLVGLYDGDFYNTRLPCSSYNSILLDNVFLDRWESYETSANTCARYPQVKRLVEELSNGDNHVNGLEITCGVNDGNKLMDTSGRILDYNDTNTVSGVKFCGLQAEGESNYTYYPTRAQTCNAASDCSITEQFLCEPSENNDRKFCNGGQRMGYDCTDKDDDYCRTVIYDGITSVGYASHRCVNTEGTAGYCIGGERHGLVCAGNTDCPAKTSTGINGQTINEYGVCVGSTLDPGKTVPSTSPVARSMERLYELFVSWYGTWKFDQATGRYAENDTGGIFDGSITTRTNDYETGCNGNGYPNEHGCNKNANVNYKKPEIHAVKRPGVQKNIWGDVNTFSLNANDGKKEVRITGGGAVNLQFFAYADNNQMPLTRIKVDWGDSTSPYITQGWFKNHKLICNPGRSYMFCGNGTNFNMPCKTTDDCGENGECNSEGSEARLFFGNSGDACQEGYFEFTHYYSCTEGGPGWVASRNQCEFVPRVQVMDNWGWCSGSCITGGGCYNGAPKQCDNTMFVNDHWVNYGNKIIIKP